MDSRDELYLFLMPGIKAGRTGRNKIEVISLISVVNYSILSITFISDWPVNVFEMTLNQFLTLLIFINEVPNTRIYYPVA